MFCLAKGMPLRLTDQQLKFPGDLGENTGRYFRSPLAIRIGGIGVLQPDHQPMKKECFRLGMLEVYF
jgi:hypothetical protein